MCIAVPMRVTSTNGLTATVERCGRVLLADAALAGDVRPGDWVLVFRETVLRRIEPAEAEEIEKALGSLAAVMAGETTPEVIEAGFADLAGGPTLPPHLAALAKAQTKEADDDGRA